MKIGFVSEALPYLPSVGGFRLYGANLIRHLGERHQVDLVTLVSAGDGSRVDWARRHCRQVETIPMDVPGLMPRMANLVATYGWARPLRPRRALAGALDRGLREQRWDVLHVEGAYAGALVDPSLRIPKILSAHDCRTLRAEEMKNCATNRREKVYHHLLRVVQPRYERLLYRRFDRCVFVARRDVEAARAVAPGIRTALIPNGVDSEHFHPVDAPKDPATLVFHGHLGYLPNVEAALELANAILPLVRREMPDAVLHLVGADPHPRIAALGSRLGVRIFADLPDLRATVGLASVYVCPVRHGTGVKNKLLEAMAMRLPIVSYPGAVAGLEAIPGIHLLVAEEPTIVARRVVELLRDPARADRLAAAGRGLVEQAYSWASRAHELERLYEEVIAESRARGPVGASLTNGERR